MSARAALRSATREAHDRIDARFASQDLTDRDDYGRFLHAQASALVPVEQALDVAGAEMVAVGWRAHRRAGLLLADLTALGISGVRYVTPPRYDDEAAIVGGLYVLEGSRLGASVLVKQVAADLPCAFLAARVETGHWSRFVASLDRLLYSSQRLEVAIDAALATFACFEGAVEQAVVA